MISDKEYDEKVRETLAKLGEIGDDNGNGKIFSNRSEEDKCLKMRVRISVVSSEEAIGGNIASMSTASKMNIKTASDPMIGLIRKDTGEFYAITGDMTVGRDEGNDIVIPEPEGQYVSGTHAMIVVDGSAVRIKDKKGGSRNGTYINGKRIKNHLIKVGDIVKFADIEFTVIRK